MRPALLFVALVGGACAPKAAPQTTPIDEDLGAMMQREGPAPVVVAAAPRPVAPTGKGLRTGTIARDKLVAVLDAGPGMFLRQLEIAPQLNGDRFVGWQLVQLLDHAGPLVDVDVVPGDVLLAINGKPLSRPDQLQTVWDSLRTANQVTAQLWRGQAQFELQFAIEPQVAVAVPAKN
jgi:S1-C subfamily serine protease